MCTEGEREGEQQPLISYNEFTVDSHVSCALLPLAMGGWPITALMICDFYLITEYTNKK